METAPSELLADVIVGVSAFALGLLAYLASTNIRGAFHTQGPARRLHLGYAVARIGIVAMVGLITEAVYRAGAVSPNWRSWVYAVAGGMVGAGYVVVVFESRHVPRDR